MKKILLMAAIVCGVICSYAGERDMSPCSDFMFDASIGFKSKNIVRGRVEMEKAITPKVKLGYQVFDGTVVYVGMDSAFGVNSKSIGLDSMLGNLDEYGRLAAMIAVATSHDYMEDNQDTINDESYGHYNRMMHYVYENISRYINKMAFVADSHLIEEIAKSSMFEHISPFIGISYDITDLFTLDVGYKHHFYTSTFLRNMNKLGKKIESMTGKHNVMNFKTCSNEIYAGIMANVLLDPSLYCFYDFERKEIAIEGTIKYSFDLSQILLSGLRIDLGAKVGYDKADQPMGLSGSFLGLRVKDMKPYCYYGCDANLVYRFYHAEMKVGVAYDGNSAEESHWANILGKKDNAWFQASVGCSF